MPKSRFSLLPSTLPALIRPLYNLPITILLSIALVAIFVASQLLGTLIFAPLVVENGKTLSIPERVLLASDNGTVVSYTVFFTLCVVMITIWLFIRAKHGNWREYLAIKGFRWSQLLGFGVLLLLLNVLINAITIWLDREPMMFMDKLVASSHPLWLLVLAMVFVAPLYEELMFRGFMWAGLAGSKLGIWGANIGTSLVFAWIHAQYGFVELGEVFLLAMLFCYARTVSGSLLLTIVLHILNNGLAMAQYLGG